MKTISNSNFRDSSFQINNTQGVVIRDCGFVVAEGTSPISFDGCSDISVQGCSFVSALNPINKQRLLLIRLDCGVTPLVASFDWEYTLTNRLRVWMMKLLFGVEVIEWDKRTPKQREIGRKIEQILT